MNIDKLFVLFENSYFYELEMREKLTTRLQIPLSVIAVLLGFLAFMLRNKEPDTDSLLFTVLFGITALLVAVAITCFIISWYGYEYKLLPTANETNKYRNEMLELYEEYDDTEELVNKNLKEYLYNSYREYSSINTVINDRKSFYLYLTNLFLIVSVLFSLATFFQFYFGDLDKSNYEKTQKVIITSPIYIDDHRNKVTGTIKPEKGK